MAKYNLSPELEGYFSKLEGEYQLPQNLLKSVAFAESSYNPNAISPVGAQGMFQFMPKTAEQYKVNVADPVSSAQGAAKMYRDLLNLYNGDVEMALAGYNWGQGNVNKKGMQNAPKETRDYISKITGLMGNTNTEKKSNMSNNNQISEAEMQAYNEYLQSQQPQVAQQNNQISPDEMQAYNEYLQSQNNPYRGVVVPNTQQPQVAPKQSQNVDNDIYQRFLTLGQEENGVQKIANLWNNISDPRQKKYLQSMLRTAYQNEVPEKKGLLEQIWQGVANSAQDTQNAFEQVGNYALSKITGNDKYINEKNQQIAQDKAIRQINDAYDPSLARDIGEIGGEIGQMALGGGVISSAMKTPGLIVKGASNAAKIADLAATGAVGNIATQPVINQQNPNDTNFLTGKATQAAVGAATGAAIGGAVNYLAPKVINKFAKADIPNEVKAAQEAAKKQGIDLTAADLPGVSNTNIAKAQDITRTNKDVNARVTEQQQQVNKAVENIKDSLPKARADDIIEETGLNKILDNPNSPYYSAAKELKEKINASSGSPNEIVKLSSEAKFLSDKNINKGQYDVAEKLAPKDLKVTLNESEKVLNEAKKHLDSLSTPSSINKFKSIFNDMESTLNKAKEGKNSYAEINSYFREIGALSREAKRAGDDVGAKYYDDFKRALTKDKDMSIDSLPDSKLVRDYQKAYSEATNFNRENIQNIKKEGFSNIFEGYTKSGAPIFSDNLIEKMVKKGETKKLENLYNKLPDSAKNAIQESVFDKMINKATKNNDIDPKAFIKAYKEYNDNAGNTPLSIIFDKQSKKTLDDLVTTLDRLKLIGYNTSNPQNGIKNMPILENIDGALRVVSAVANPMNVVMLGKPIITFLKNKNLANHLKDKNLNSKLLDLQNTNPNSVAYAEKLARLSVYIANNFENKREQK